MSTDNFYRQVEALDENCPPVEKWQPALSGDMDCVIQRDGSWLIDGNPLENTRLLRLFSKVLKYEDGEYFLVSPVEKWRIQVEDLPFTVVEMDLEDAGKDTQALCLRTNVGDTFTVDREHAIETRPLSTADGTVPVAVVHVRNGLFARFNRSCHLALAEFLLENGDNDEYILQSSGARFILQF